MQRTCDPNILFNTVGMMRMRSAKSVLLTEADRDSDLYRKFVDESRCLVRPAGSRDKVLEMLKRFGDSKMPAVTGIIDADSDYVLKKSLPREDVTRTDGADKETTIIDSPAFIIFCGSLNCSMAPSDLRTELFDSAHDLGILRRLSARENWGINFKVIRHPDFLDTNFTCNRTALLNAILRGNPDLPLDFEALEAALADRVCASLPQSQIVQGHDLIQILAIRSALLFRKVMTPIEIEYKLMALYETVHFASTNTHSDLRAMQSRFPPAYLMFEG